MRCAFFYKASLYYYRLQRGAEMRKGGDESRRIWAAPRCAPKARIKRARAAGSLHEGAARINAAQEKGGEQMLNYTRRRTVPALRPPKGGRAALPVVRPSAACPDKLRSGALFFRTRSDTKKNNTVVKTHFNIARIVRCYRMHCRKSGNNLFLL